MYDHATAILAQNLVHLRLLLKDFPESALDKRPYEGGHSARWVLGHLAVTPRWIASFLKVQSVCPEAWEKLFGPGTSGETSGGPTLSEFLDVIDRDAATLTAAMRAADPAATRAPHGLDWLQGQPLTTVGDVVAFLVTAHFGYHLAQLSACRRSLGLPNVA